MTEKVNWKEQAVVVPVSESLGLEGAWQRGAAVDAARRERGALLAAAHPLFGGSLDHPVLNELAHALYRAGVSSLRFNWRGVGASQGQLSGERVAADEDWAAALAQICADIPPPLIAGGYSFGAITALRSALADRRIGRLLLVAPPLRMLEGVALEALQIPVRVLVGEHDAFCSPQALALRFAPVGDARIEVLSGADHFFASRGLTELGERVRCLLD